jgi:membrane-associated phospholipid phosphatase
MQSRGLNLREYALPLAALIAVTLVSRIPVSANSSLILIGYVVTLPLYMAYVGSSMVVLILPFTRLFPSVNGDLKRTGWWALDISLCSLLMPHLLKFVLQLPRPSGSPSGAISGHTAFAFSLAWLVWKTFPRLGPFWFAAAVAVGWSRIQTEAHYPYQVPLGAILGLVMAWGVTHFADGVLLPRIVQFPARRAERRARIAASRPAQS